MAIAAPEMWRAASAVLRPPPAMSPSEFAGRYRYLKEGTTSKPGLWSNEVFPYLVAIMDAIEEAIRTGKRGVVLMKGGQGGGSESIINAWAWLQTYFPGPMLYLISKDEIAREFGRERFAHIAATCRPLARKHLTGRGSGELIHVKRFMDGKLVIQGGRSVLNLQSSPYRIVIIDEVDSLLDEIEGHGDPLKLAEIRTDAFPGETLIIAFAHPSTRDRGAGKLYYELSDQRRGHIRCPHCDDEFWLTWEHVQVFPHPGQNSEAAANDPSAYRYVTPCCGVILTDAERYAAVARGVRQLSTLPPEVAATRTWIGVHFGQLYMSNKPLAFLAEKWIEAQRAGDAALRVVVNKRWGDVYDQAQQETTVEDWRRLIVVPRHGTDPDAYHLGQAPQGVQWLTAGQDSRADELHWDVWGWGLLRDQIGITHLCGWLIDYGVVKRRRRQGEAPTLDAADLRVFDQLIYERSFSGTTAGRYLRVAQGGHDQGWQPVAVWEYCRRAPARSIPVRGDAVDDRSKAPPLRWGNAPRWTIGGHEVSDPRLKPALLNTYALKLDFFGLVDRRIVLEDGRTVSRLTLPVDVGDDWLEQAASERLVVHKQRLTWKARGPNHWSDCSIYAYALALNCRPFVSQTREEAQREAQNAANVTARRRSRLGHGRRAQPKKIRTRYQ